MIREVPGRKPRVHPDAYVDPQAAVIGDVTIDAGASVWPFTVLRGDQDNYVRLGKNSNVQDNSVLHVTPEFPCIVGDNVTIGHRAVVHACTIMNNVRIGIGAVVLNGAVVEEGAEFFVFEANDDHFDRRPVHVEYRDQDWVVIANDGALKVGAMVAASAAHQVQLALKSRTGGGVDPHAGHNH